MASVVRRAALMLLAILAGCSQMATPPGETFKEAPEIVALNAENQPMKLSEYRGKVVLLDFWFTECPYCRQFEPQEKELLKHYENRPFVILGVNTDGTLDQLVKTQKEDKLPWRNWWDGPEAPITRQWHVRYFPTVYLIDQVGRVRAALGRKAASGRAGSEVGTTRQGGGTASSHGRKLSRHVPRSTSVRRFDLHQPHHRDGAWTRSDG